MKLKKETVIRTVLLVLALVNQVLCALDLSPIPYSESALYDWLSLGFTAAMAIWSWWKNNSFTRAAREADAYLEELKKEEKE